MLGSILIGLDGPEHGTILTELGIRWAKRTGATLVGLGLVDEPGIRAIEPAWAVGGSPGKDPVYYMGYEPRLADVHQQVGQLLEQFAARCEEAGVAHAERKLVGPPYELMTTESQSCDLILLAQGFHFRFTGQDSEGPEIMKKILRESPRPVVLVPETPIPDGPVAVAYDGSLQAARALWAFQATGLAESGRVEIICVGTNNAEAERHADLARQFLGFHKIEAISLVLESSASPAKVILEQCDRSGAGLLVMGAYGQPNLREFFVGSVTRTILEESSIPVFLFY
ncbi:MAG: universal stress protein [Isosphaeraceae bacterium]